MRRDEGQTKPPESDLDYRLKEFSLRSVPSGKSDTSLLVITERTQLKSHFTPFKNMHTVQCAAFTAIDVHLVITALKDRFTIFQVKSGAKMNIDTFFLL